MKTKTKPKSKLLKVETIQRMFKVLNDLLATSIPQETKAVICTQIECLLMDLDLYGGYQDLYWTNGGYTAWREAGEPDFDQGKMKFCIGPNAFASNNDPQFTSKLEGEYSRSYFMKSI